MCAPISHTPHVINQHRPPKTNFGYFSPNPGGLKLVREQCWLNMSEEQHSAAGNDPGLSENVPDEVKDLIEESSEAELRALMRYVRETLESRDGDTNTTGRASAIETSAGESSTTETPAASGSDSQTEPADERPEGVPSKATRVVKEINDNRYYYWQWRDGDAVKSKYDRPADPE